MKRLLKSLNLECLIPLLTGDYWIEVFVTKQDVLVTIWNFLKIVTIYGNPVAFKFAQKNDFWYTTHSSRHDLHV